MTSRESEPRQSMGPPQSVKHESRKDPNPHTDYRGHFNRTKQRFDIVTADQAIRRKELDRASTKQIKLQEELEYLLDTIAGEQLRQKQLRRVIEESLSPSIALYHPEQEPSLGVREATREASELDDNAGHAKRQRPSPTDTEEELLAAAGVPTKRFRED